MGGYRLRRLRLRRLRLRRLRLRIGAKFSLVLGLLTACLLDTVLVSTHAQARMKAEADRQYRENIVNMHRVAVLNATLAQAGWTALEMIPTDHPGRLTQLRESLYNDVVPDLERQVAALREDAETAEEQTFANQVSVDWQAIKVILTSPAVQATLSGPTSEQANERLAARLLTALDAAGAAMADMNGAMAAHARTAHTRIDGEYRRTRQRLAVIVVAALLVGIGRVLWLIRDLVPRIGAYSRFAAEVAAGRLSARLHPTGADELSDLGRALNHMVERRAAGHDYDTSQAAFSTTLQATENESEAHVLLKRHLERCLPGAAVVVLNRNNSANRLQPTTGLADDGDLTARLATAPPRACLAVRLARPHAATARHEALLPCTVCAHAGTASRCEPLIIGGEVIGSVLVQRSQLSDQDDRRIRESVMHAAPVLANLRNLALAEHRALTEALTGLPNQRASHDTVLRMAAHAARTLSPLTAALLDLDHFKQINDLYGHDKGDEVLAAVGTTLATALRASDFAGRYGGEEFLLLLPDIGSGEPTTIAERLRTAVSALTIPSVDQPVTASLGITVLPDQGDAATLLRKADAALYAAKAAGRNRIHVAADTKDVLRDRTDVRQPEPSETAS